MGLLGAAGSAAVVIWATALCVADLRRHRLPNWLTVPGAGMILIAALVAGRGGAALLGGVLLGGSYLVIHLADPAGLGGGDVKLAVGLGALTGALGDAVWVLAAVGAPILTAAAGVVSLSRGRGGAVPHGPSMVLASLTAAALAVL